MKKPFRIRVLEVVRVIPKGQVLTYKQVAERAGSPRAYRAVGTIMKGNWDPHIPCHRVVASNGIGGWNRGTENKRKLLREEGVCI